MSVRRLTVRAAAVLFTTVGLVVFASAPALATKEYVAGGTFGAEGTGNGQFTEPIGVAVSDATGDVYVVDKGNSRVEQLSSSGTYLSQFNGSVGPPTGVFASPEQIAVDNSGSALDPSNGDVYVADTGHKVIDQFTASGTYVGQMKETTGGSLFGELLGVAVDSSGNLWVYEGEGHLDEFSDTSAFLKTFITGRGAQLGVAVDSSENIYATCCGEQVGKFDPSTERQLAEFAGGNTTALALNQSTNSLLVDKGADVELYGPFAEPPIPTQMFPSEPELALSESHGIAVNDASAAQTVYASQRGADNVEIFNDVLFPGVTVEPASEVTNTEETLNGKVNPEGEAIEECRFEFGLSEAQAGHYEHSVPCAQTPSSITGTSFVPVSTVVSGLQPAATYHFRLHARNANGTKSSNDEVFSLFPLLENESVSNVGSTEATLSAQITPGGVPTTYRAEYGTTPAYGSATPEVSAGAGSVAAGVQIVLSGLQPETVYHVRVVASNELGVEPGGEETFTTSTAPGASVSTLPDGRVYELASPAGHVDVYEPFSLIDGTTNQNSLYSGRPFRASADGNAVAYVAEPASSGGSGSQGEGSGDEYLAMRTPQGWTTSDIIPSGGSLGTEYVAFSNDLSVGIVGGLEKAGAAPCNKFYARTGDGLLHPFFTEQPSAASCDGLYSTPSFDGASADYSHLLYENQAALTPGAKEADPGQYNLYDSVDGHLRLVNVLPGGEPDPNAMFGGPDNTVGEKNSAPGFTNAISRNGSRIFWTDLNTDRLYMRMDGTVTVSVSGGAAEFWTATPDGRYVLYTEGQGSASRLWRFAVDTFEESKKPEAQALADAREALTGEGAGVRGVIGVNETGEDGGYVYFVADGILARNENSNGDKAAEGVPNLYVLSGRETKFIATLSPEDNSIGHGEARQQLNGDWRHNPGDLSSEVTPDGHSVGFVSRMSLTGYDNRGRNEVYVYDHGTGRISCASCNPSGLAPVWGAKVPFTDTAGYSGSTYMVRWLSEDGSRVFFNSEEPLLPQVTDGRSNVYEWERQGTGSCERSAGCTYVLSGGGSPDVSYLVDASADGNDVFFTSREGLTPHAGSETVKLYDARVEGGFPENSTACTGTGCQGVPPAQPIFATPSSVTFNGVGNFQASTPGKTVTAKKKRTVAQIRAEKLSKALRACGKRPKRKRSACKKQARKKYAPAKKKGQR